MNICFISSEYPPETGYGGIGTYTKIMAAALSEKENTVTVISLSRNKQREEFFDKKVKVVRVGPGTYPLPKGRLFWRLRMVAYYLIPHSLVRMAYACSVAEEYENLSKQKAFDFIEAPDCGAEAFYIKRSRAEKLIIRLHTPYSFSLSFNDNNTKWIDRKILELMEKSCCKKADFITSPTLALSLILKKRWGLRSISVFPNPIDKRVADKGTIGNYIVCPGRVEYRKGIHLLIKAYAKAVKNGCSVKLIIIGRPYGTITKTRLTYEQLIQNLIKKLGVEDMVQWIQGMEREEMLKLVSCAKAALFPAVWDNYPYACLEAMAAGVPTICFRTGGFPEIIRDNIDGLLVSPFDCTDMAEKLNRVLTDSDFAKKLSVSAIARVEELCNPEAIAQKFELGIKGNFR